MLSPLPGAGHTAPGTGLGVRLHHHRERPTPVAVRHCSFAALHLLGPSDNCNDRQRAN